MPLRISGCLLHPTSLPGDFGVGDLGAEALGFLELLRSCDQTFWQMLPLGPVGHSLSPYDCRSSFAGNQQLISPQRLYQDGLLSRRQLDDRPKFAPGILDPQALVVKDRWLRAAWQKSLQSGAADLVREQEVFEASGETRAWLDDWVLYAALRRRLKQAAWFEWPAGLRDRQADELAAARLELEDEIRFQRFVQFQFYRQWQVLTKRASELGVLLCGDLPIYVAHDSAEVWSHRQLFELDAQGRPLWVGGVPPDAFSDDGQLWGNPTYRWPAHRSQNYRWWRRRFAAALNRFDWLRLDHFRGFVAYWKVPGDATSARHGHWARGPGRALFQSLRADPPKTPEPLPVIAEDLGHITEPVRRLRRELGLLGTRVLQFGFDDPRSEHRVDAITSDTVAYSGTHDNDTSLGWFLEQPAEQRDRIAQQVGVRPCHQASEQARRVARRLVEQTFESAATIAIAPLQDLLRLGSDARMNRPGTSEGNWRWRAPKAMLDPSTCQWLREITLCTGRKARDVGAVRHARG